MFKKEEEGEEGKEKKKREKRKKSYCCNYLALLLYPNYPALVYPE